jgi:hypothetical protein
MPLFPVGPSMLGNDRITLLEPYQTSYMMFLASQIPDLISFFESCHQRTKGTTSVAQGPTRSILHCVFVLPDPGTVTLDDEPTTPPFLLWGTPNTSGNMSTAWHNNNTPDRGEKPQSGLCFPRSLSTFLALLSSNCSLRATVA